MFTLIPQHKFLIKGFQIVLNIKKLYIYFNNYEIKTNYIYVLLHLNLNCNVALNNQTSNLRMKFEMKWFEILLNADSDP